MRWTRSRAVARWACTATALIVAVAAVFCIFGSASYKQASKDGRGVWWLQLASGQIQFTEVLGYGLNTSTGLGWRIGKRGSWSWAMTELPSARGGFVWFWPSGATGVRLAGTTLLYPFLLTAVPAVLLRRRRHRPGVCGSCGYSREGAAPSSPCPECGMVPA